MKRTLLLAFLLAMASSVFAAEPARAAFADDPAPASSDAWYVAWNPAATLAFCELGFGDVLIPLLVSDLEYGVAVSAGRELGSHAVEVRASVGTSSGLFVVTMLQAGYLYRFAEPFGLGRGLYAGAFLRFWELYNPNTSVTTYSAGPYAVLGWRLDVDRFFFDLRVSQGIAVVSWSDQEHTAPGFSWMLSPLPKISPVLPTVGLNVGVRLAPP